MDIGSVQVTISIGFEDIVSSYLSIPSLQWYNAYGCTSRGLPFDLEGAEGRLNDCL